MFLAIGQKLRMPVHANQKRSRRRLAFNGLYDPMLVACRHTQSITQVVNALVMQAVNPSTLKAADTTLRRGGMTVSAEVRRPPVANR